MCFLLFQKACTVSVQESDLGKYEYQFPTGYYYCLFDSIMDAPVDFSLDRARILNGNITPYNGSNFNDSGRSASVGGGGGCVQDLNRGSTTPSTSGDFHRYFHPAGVTLGPQGTSSNTRFLLPQAYELFSCKIW